MSKKPPRGNVQSFPKGQYTYTQMQLMVNTVADALRRRGQIGKLGKQYGTKRDVYDVLGYNPKPSVDDYWNFFLREDIAKRIVQAPSKAIWRKPPEICETDNPDRETEFEKKWDELNKTHKIWSYFSRADNLAGIGYYAILLIGMPGALTEEVRAATGPGQRLLFLSPYSQRNASVKEYEASVQSDRFGKPLNYAIDTAGDLSGGRTKASVAARLSKMDVVHHSRVLHFADELLEDELNGTPRLEAIFNRLFDLQKVIGGSAEGYWRGAYGGFALEAAKDAVSAYTSGTEIDPDTVDEFAHGMRRWIDAEGYHINRIEGQDFKPKEVFEVIIAAISSATSIPQRLLLGSERGSLASEQDETNWKDFIEERRSGFAEPLIRDFIDRLIMWKVLPEPKEYRLEWPSLYTKTDKEKSEIFKNFTQGIAAVAPGGQTELIATPKEIRTADWGLGFEADPETGLELDPADIIAPEPAGPPNQGT